MKNAILIIGAGAVAKTVIKKCASQKEIFKSIIVASRTKSKCDQLAQEVYQRYGVHLQTEKLDAENTQEVIRCIEKYSPLLVLHVALPYQNLSIMEACLQTKTNYIDTANYESREVAKFEYEKQWAYHDAFKKAKITAILGAGFDPGVTNVFTKYAMKHHFDEIHFLDIIDCNDGEHGKPFATNFNTEINIREITQKGKFWRNGKWIEIPPMSLSKWIEYPSIGKRKSYLIYHEELESLSKNIPHLKRARFWMTFSKNYLNHLEVLKNVGLTNIKPINYKGQKIVPLELLQHLLPNPDELAEGYEGKTCIGCHIEGIRDGKPKKYFIYNISDHRASYQELGTHAVSFTTGVPVMITAKLVLQGVWNEKGVLNMETLNPDPFMEYMKQDGLPWRESLNE